MAVAFSLSLSPLSQSRVVNTIQCSSSSSNPNQIANNGSLSSFPEKQAHLVSSAPNKIPPPPRPRRIILVRHGESEGNVDESAYTRTADPKISLTNKGMAQAKECGKTIRDMIERDGVHNWQVYFYVSPYRRTRQTLRGLGQAFERSRIAGVREEPRLREQDFGNLVIIIENFLSIFFFPDLIHNFSQGIFRIGRK